MTIPAPRYLIVGLGSIGQRHLRNLLSLRPGAEIAALRLRSGGDVEVPDGCCAQFTSMDEALAFRPDAAIIAGPAPTHVPVADALVGMGIPVLIEKPFSHDMAGLQALTEKAQSGGVPVMVGYNMRFNPALAMVRAEVLGGVIGDVMLVRAEVGQYLPDWRSGTDYRKGVSAQRQLGGGPLLELSHEIDYLYWFFGMPDRVTCRGDKYSNLEIDVEDAVQLWLEYDQPKRLVSISLDFLQRSVSRNCKFIGSRGTMLWDGLEDQLHVTLAEPNSRSFSVSKPMTDRNEMYVEELRHFLCCAESGSQPLIDARQGIDVMAIVAAARKSMETGRSHQPDLCRNSG